MEGNFNNIILPAHVIAELYKEDLVILSADSVANVNPSAATKIAETVAQKPTENKPLSWLGNNAKNITVLVYETEAKHLNDEDLAQLAKILTACKLNLADIAIVNYANHPVSYTTLLEALSPKVMLLFDVNPLAIQLPFTVPHYQVQKHNNITFLFATSLTGMRNNNDEKRKLWDGLKKVFGL